MGLFDKAKDLAAEHPDAIDKGLDKAADFADERTGGQYTEQIQQGADFAQDKAAEFLGQDDQDNRDNQNNEGNPEGR